MRTRQRAEDKDSVLSLTTWVAETELRSPAPPLSGPVGPLALYFSKHEADLHLLTVFNHYTVACILKPERFF